MSKWETIKGSAGFFVTMAVCLLVIGVSGYYLLLDDSEESPPSVVETPPVETAVTAPVEEPLLPEEPATETLAPVITGYTVSGELLAYHFLGTVTARSRSTPTP